MPLFYISMEDSRFRWLDADTDIDLGLDNYQQQVASPPSCLPPRRRPSFRRALSFNSVNLSRKSTSLAFYGKTPTFNPPAEPQFVLANIIGSRSSHSRPTSKSKPCHASQSLASSIDPYAQYYHDPEARLKLRVFFASPQKFDEAIEFGFPALKEKGAPAQKSVHAGSDLRIQEFEGTFLDDDDDASIRGDEGLCSRIPRLSYVPEICQDSHDLSFLDKKNRQSWMPLPQPSYQQTLNTREMTLRMTLTRPNLRTDSCLIPNAVAEPTQLLHLPLPDNNPEFWERGTEGQNLVKKMWRRLRWRKD
ncbi:hypothetical protein BDW62DRAFT_188466 [Aspergillus aurantiobrunneus]